MQDLCTENYKTLWKSDLNKERDVTRSSIGALNIMMMLILPKLMYNNKNTINTLVTLVSLS